MVLKIVIIFTPICLKINYVGYKRCLFQDEPYKTTQITQHISKSFFFKTVYVSSRNVTNAESFRYKIF